MPLPLPYKDIKLYVVSKKLTYACYELTGHLPVGEQHLSYEQIRKAALYLFINIAAAVSSTSKKMSKRYLKKARDYLVMMDAAIELMLDLNYLLPADSAEVAALSNQCYKLLRKKLKKK